VNCFNCKWWKREKGGSWGECGGWRKGKTHVDIIVAGGYSTPDGVRTYEKFFCASFKNKHRSKT